VYDVLDPDARLRPADAARVAGVSRQLVNWWRSRGKLQPDTDGKLRLGDVLQVERDTRRSKHSRRLMPA
jgi:hypothetical protein